MNKKCTHCGEENKPNHKYCFYCGYELQKIEKNATEEVKNTKAGKRNLGLKKLTKVVVWVLFFALGYFGVQHFLFNTPALDKLLMNTASELNENCPFMVDQYTRLDNAVALPDNIFQYNYTLVDMVKSEVNLDTVKKYIEPGLIQNVKTNPDMKFFRDNQTTLIYHYKDTEGVFVVKFKITPELYKD